MPGLTLMEIAKIMGQSRNYVVNYTTSMDRGGFLLSEDESGALYPFKVMGQKEAMALWRQIWT
jgi:hypothetical protein